MNLDDLKAQYAQQGQATLPKAAMASMLKVGKHPAIRRIRLQLIIETVAWALFMALYYNGFDGHLRPWYWNVALALAVALLLVHNLLGFRIMAKPINGESLKASLGNYLDQLKRYGYASISARALAILMLFGYFLAGVDALGPRHLLAIPLALLVTGVQLFFLWRIWQGRIQRIANQYAQFEFSEPGVN